MPSYRQPSRIVRMSTDLKPNAQIMRSFRILLQDLKNSDPIYFAGALVWIRSWGFWNEDSENLGEKLITSLRRDGVGPGVPSLADAPIHLFAKDELVSAHAAVSIAMLFQWDALVVPESGDFIAHISHHLNCQIEARSNAIASEIEDRFTSVGWLSSRTET